VIFNEAKMTYKNPVEKSELLLDSLYLKYKDDDIFQSVRNNDDDQSVRKRENPDSENLDQEENLTKTAPPADSPTEVQPVGGNLTSPHADSPQQVVSVQINYHIGFES
jgi:hypothetical protein